MKHNIAFNLIAKGFVKKGTVEAPNLFPDLETNIFYRLSDFTAEDFPTPITGYATSVNNGVVELTSDKDVWDVRYIWKVIDDNGGLNFFGASNMNHIWSPRSGTAWLNFEFLNGPVTISNVLLRPLSTSSTSHPNKFFLEGSNDGVNYEPISDVYGKPTTNPYGSVLLFAHYNINPDAKKFTHIRAGFGLGTLSNANYQYIQDLYLYGV